MAHRASLFAVAVVAAAAAAVVAWTTSVAAIVVVVVAAAVIVVEEVAAAAAAASAAAAVLVAVAVVAFANAVVRSQSRRALPSPPDRIRSPTRALSRRDRRAVQSRAQAPSPATLGNEIRRIRN